MTNKSRKNSPQNPKTPTQGEEQQKLVRSLESYTCHFSPKTSQAIRTLSLQNKQSVCAYASRILEKHVKHVNEGKVPAVEKEGASQ